MGDEDSVENRPEPIEDPDIDDPKNLAKWLEKYVKIPFKGYEDLTHPDGTPLSIPEQVQASRNQLRMMAEQMPELGAGKAEIIQNLKEGVVGLQDNPELKS